MNEAMEGVEEKEGGGEGKEKNFCRGLALVWIRSSSRDD